jgi:hypothetical protein
VEASWPPEQDVDHGPPFWADIGHVAVFAQVPREDRFPRCIADVVKAELTKSQGEGAILGRFAAGLLARVGWRA